VSELRRLLGGTTALLIGMGVAIGSGAFRTPGEVADYLPAPSLILLAWLLGGLALYALARRIASADGALVALLYYLFLDFGVIASRSFQPDPLMVGLFGRFSRTMTTGW